MLNARASLTDNESTLKSNMFSLRSFLMMDEETEIIPIMPETFSTPTLVYEDVLQKALQNNSITKNLARRRMEADYNVASARGNLRSINLTAQVGIDGTGQHLSEAYNPLNDNQYVKVGVQIPLLDWGKRRGRLRVAKSSREITAGKDAAPQRGEALAALCAGFAYTLHQPLDKVQAYIALHCDEKLTLTSLADGIGFSSAYLCDLFRKKCGIQLFSFIKQVRLGMACHLLRTTALPVNAVSGTVRLCSDPVCGQAVCPADRGHQG